MGVAPEWAVVQLAAEQVDTRAHARVLDAPGCAASSLPSLVGAQLASHIAIALLKILASWASQCGCERKIATLRISNNGCSRGLPRTKLLFKCLI